MLGYRLAALVLAAGGGSRLGGGKLNLVWQGKSLASHVLLLAERAACFDCLVCVAGYGARELCRGFAEAGLCGDWPGDREKVAGAAPSLHLASRGVQPSPFWSIVTNPLWAEGQSTSLRAGLAWLASRAWPEGQGAGPDGVMVLLGDQPLVRPETVRLLASEHAQAACGRERALATAPVFQGRRGNPVVLGRELFPALAEITGDTGARSLLRELGPRLHLVPVKDSGVFFDVDTPADYANLRRGEPFLS